MDIRGNHEGTLNGITPPSLALEAPWMSFQKNVGPWSLPSIPPEPGLSPADGAHHLRLLIPSRR